MQHSYANLKFDPFRHSSAPLAVPSFVEKLDLASLPIICIKKEQQKKNKGCCTQKPKVCAGNGYGIWIRTFTDGLPAGCLDQAAVSRHTARVMSPALLVHSMARRTLDHPSAPIKSQQASECIMMPGVRGPLQAAHTCAWKWRLTVLDWLHQRNFCSLPRINWKNSASRKHAEV